MLLATHNLLWYLLPLTLAISLVYSASRFEAPSRILHRAMQLFVQITLFLGVVFVLLLVLSDGL